MKKPQLFWYINQSEFSINEQKYKIHNIYPIKYVIIFICTFLLIISPELIWTYNTSEQIFSIKTSEYFDKSKNEFQIRYLGN